MASVTYGKCYLRQRYYGKCNYGKSIMANETKPVRPMICLGHSRLSKGFNQYAKSSSILPITYFKQKLKTSAVCGFKIYMSKATRSMIELVR